MNQPLDTLFRWIYRLAHAVLVVYAFFFRPAVRGVNVAVWHGNRLLMVENSYRRGYSFPGGYVKSGEKPKTAAVRELKEEVGLAVYPNQLKHVRQYRSTVLYKRETIDLFEVRLTGDAALSVDGREVVWAGFMRPEEALTEQLGLQAKMYLEDVAGKSIKAERK